jgi:hypothetical protein
MIRGVMLSLTVIAATVEPALGDIDLIRYAITQGGLLAVVLVLLWQMRGMSRDQQRHSRALETLVDHSTTALVNSTIAVTRQAETSERVARALENLERRHR